MSRLSADLAWHRGRAGQWVRKHTVARFRHLPSDTPDVCRSTRRIAGAAAPMRDGVRLFGDVYLPAPGSGAGDGPWPTVLIRIPYGRREAYCAMPAHGRFWARKGYACVIQDVRGRWSSEGVFREYVNEARDGWDTLDWVAAQPWCDGAIGMVGESYYGSTQWAVASSGHPNLRCLAPGDVDPDFYTAWRDGGAFCLGTAGIGTYEFDARTERNHHRFDVWHLPLISSDEVAGGRSDAYRKLIEHPSRDAYWDELNASCRYEEVALPMLHWGGWCDIHVNGTIAGWRKVREGSRDAATRAHQWLLFGGTDHELSPESTGLIGRTPIHAHGFAHDRVREFFDRWLKGVDNGYDDRPRVQYFVIGKNEWRAAADWPPPATRFVEYYLGSSGAAGAAADDGVLDLEGRHDEPPDAFVYDPDAPVGYWVERDIWAAARTMADRREVEARDDVLVYTTPWLAEALEVTGPIVVRLFAASSARDTDFTAALVDVFPDGFAQLVREGIVRARYRESVRAPSLIEPGEVYEYGIDLGSTSYLFPRGHRLRLEISSSNFDRYDRNLNTGGKLGFESRRVSARQSVFHDTGRPSRLVLPVGA